MMNNSENRRKNFNETPMCVIGILVLILLAVLLLWHNNATSMQATNAIAADVYFDGEYRIGDGEWSEIVEGKHISATEGDVTLKGNFRLRFPDGEFPFEGDVPLAFYMDHVSATIYEKGQEPYMMDHESPMFGDSACGIDWSAYSMMGNSEDPMKIVIHNPHRFGNETAVDEFLDNLAIWGTFDFESGILEAGKSQRTIGLLFAMASLAILGIALFSTLLHVKRDKIMWLMGLATLSAGGYIAYDELSVSFWSESVANNTAVLGFCMMLYMLFLLGIITYYLQKAKKTVFITVCALGIFDGICFLVPIVTQISFYDTWFVWVIVQSVANVVFLGCVISEFIKLRKHANWVYGVMAVPLITYELDAIATTFGWWNGGLISKCIFVALFIIIVFVVLKIVPESINATAKAKELELQSSRLEAEKNMIEAELNENRIAIMLSQIKPHFIYNTLGTIERMCLKDPKKAFELVRNFSLYLRGNFSELESVTPIQFAEEMKHVEHYVNIEKVRFPDMDIEYDLKSMDFALPALSVQPLVENAIKHGLMGLESGGKIVIGSYETDTHFCVEVKDDGVGFDTTLPIDGKKHIGLRNIEGRLKTMVDGELIVESEVDGGTKAKIMIPKEVNI